MKLRFKFIAFISLLFTLLMLFSVVVIYFLFEKNRERDYNKRLWAQAYYAYSNWSHAPLPDSIKNVVDIYRFGSIATFHFFIVDANTHKIVTSNDAKESFIPSVDLLKTVKIRPFYGEKEDAQIVVIPILQPQSLYLICYGYDRFGFLREKTLKRILSIVVMLGIALIIGCATVFVSLITKPLLRLGLQMQRISENNLDERIKVKSRNFNQEEAQIAMHFNAMLDRLQRSFELQKSFVHHASHELRTPLATMLAQTELALNKNLTIEEARKVLLSLKEDQEEMVELTNSLLLLSQYERTHTSPEWPVLRLDELLYETMGMIKRMLPNANVSLQFAQMPDNELFLSIQGNESLIRSAFRNLIKNAWLYSENKSVAITIDSSSSDIYLHFDNNGKLLSLEEQERLFVPFFRASNSSQKKGFGLGLNIILRIITLHKGSIGYIIYNNLNRFTLRFPKLQASTLDL